MKKFVAILTVLVVTALFVFVKVQATVWFFQNWHIFALIALGCFVFYMIVGTVAQTVKAQSKK